MGYVEIHRKSQSHLSESSLKAKAAVHKRREGHAKWVKPPHPFQKPRSRRAQPGATFRTPPNSSQHDPSRCLSTTPGSPGVSQKEPDSLGVNLLAAPPPPPFKPRRCFAQPRSPPDPTPGPPAPQQPAQRQRSSRIPRHPVPRPRLHPQPRGPTPT